MICFRDSQSSLEKIHRENCLFCVLHCVYVCVYVKQQNSKIAKYITKYRVTHKLGIFSVDFYKDG